MFERYTDEARRVVVLAQEEARTLQHAQVGTEHLLLALLHEDRSEAVGALHRVGADPVALRRAVLAVVGQGAQPSPPDLHHTRQAKTVLELAERESVQLGSCEVGPSDLLLGLLRCEDGLAGTVLRRHGVDLAAVRVAVDRQSEAGSTTTPTSRFVRSWAGDEPTLSTPLLIERFDDEAWQALTVARRAARRRADQTVRTVDLLFGVAAAGGQGADVLAAAGQDPDAVCAAIQHRGRGRTSSYIGTGQSRGALRVEGAARHVLRWAAEDADRRGHPAAGTAHVLLALLSNADADFSSALDALGVAQHVLRAEAIAALDDTAALHIAG